MKIYEQLDITASFEPKELILGCDLIKVVAQLAGTNFLQQIGRANDNDIWYYVRRASQSPVEQCIVLGDGDLITKEDPYKIITVKYFPGSKTGIQHSVGYVDFPRSVLEEVRNFRDKLKEAIENPSKTPSKKTKSKLP